MELTPLQIAGKVVEEMLEVDLPVLPNECDGFGCKFNDSASTLSASEAEVRWYQLKSLIVVEVAVPCNLSRIPNPRAVCDRLERIVEPFLEGICDAPGKIEIWPDEECPIPFYSSRVDYEPLEAEEFITAFRACFLRGVRMTSLLAPIFACLNVGHVPPLEQQLRMLQIRHGLWEINDQSSDVPRNGVRFPKRLFGGISQPLSQ